MSAQDIIRSLTGQKVSQKSTFLPHTLNNLIRNISRKTRYNGSKLISLGHIILIGNCSCDRAIEVCYSKRDHHLEIFCSHNGQKLRSNALNYFSYYDVIGLKRNSVDLQYELFLRRVIDRFAKIAMLAIHYGEISEDAFLARTEPISFREKSVENLDLLQHVKGCAYTLSVDIAIKDGESAKDRFGELLGHVDNLKKNVGMTA